MNTSSLEPVLSLDGVSRRFVLKDGRRVHAVEGVDLQVFPGETVAIVGESGCGKSTLANLAIRLEHADEGRVVLDGVDITNLKERRLRQYRQKVQMIFQDAFASLNPRESVGRIIGEPLRLHSDLNPTQVRERVQGLLLRVGLDGSVAKKFPHQFSGGQRQRICIARAIASSPKLIVADEATSALDVTVRAKILNLMLDLQDRLGIAYLFVSHDLAVVERIAHRVAVMYLGQIVELGTRRQIFENPTHPYTRLLLDAVPVADPRKREHTFREVRDLRSPVWDKGTGPIRVQMQEIEPGHFVAEDDGTWAVAEGVGEHVAV